MTEKDESLKGISIHPLVGEAQVCETPQCASPSYELAFTDLELIMRDEMRGLRLELEMMKPDLILKEFGIKRTVVIFGGSRVKTPEQAAEALQDAEGKRVDKKALDKAKRDLELSRYYEEARRLGELVTRESGKNGVPDLHVITGGGPGIMEAGNRGAQDAGGKSIGLSIVLPREQRPNAYVTPELSFQFYYFAIRKMHFLMRAKALVAFPGGFGTLDELFESLTLVQAGKIPRRPILLFGREYWEPLVDFHAMARAGMIEESDVQLIRYVETAEEAWDVIAAEVS